MYVATETPPVPHRTAGGFYKSAGLCQNAAMCGCLNWLVDLFKGGRVVCMRLWGWVLCLNAAIRGGVSELVGLLKMAQNRIFECS